MNRTYAPVGHDVDEMRLEGLTPAPSRLVAPTRVKESPVAFECCYWRTIDLPGRNGGPGTHSIVLGQVSDLLWNGSITEFGKLAYAK